MLLGALFSGYTSKESVLGVGALMGYWRNACIMNGAGIFSVRSCIYFQNGVLDFERDEFRSCDGWRESIESIYSYYDAGLGGQWRDACGEIILRGGPEGREEVELFESTIKSINKTLYTYLRSTFPDDYASWIQCLCIIGYCLLADNPLEKFFFLYGPAGTGKTTLGNIVRYLVGDRATGVVALDQFNSEKEGLYHAAHKVFCFCDEAPQVEGGKFKYSSAKGFADKLKDITSANNKCIVRSSYGRPLEVRIGSKFIFASNNKSFLELKDDSGGLLRRLVALEMTDGVGFGGDINFALSVVLGGSGGVGSGGSSAGGLATIAAESLRIRWALGKERVFKLEQSRAYAGAMDMAQEGLDPLGHFLKGLLVIDDRDEAARLPVALVYEIAEEWASQRGEELLSGEAHGRKNKKIILRALKNIKRDIESSRSLKKIRVQGNILQCFSSIRLSRECLNSIYPQEDYFERWKSSPVEAVRQAALVPRSIVLSA